MSESLHLLLLRRRVIAPAKYRGTGRSYIFLYASLEKNQMKNTNIIMCAIKLPISENNGLAQYRTFFFMRIYLMISTWKANMMYWQTI